MGHPFHAENNVGCPIISNGHMGYPMVSNHTHGMPHLRPKMSGMSLTPRKYHGTSHVFITDTWDVPCDVKMNRTSHLIFCMWDVPWFNKEHGMSHRVSIPLTLYGTSHSSTNNMGYITKFQFLCFNTHKPLKDYAQDKSHSIIHKEA
jgi:hypothetical protein